MSIPVWVPFEPTEAYHLTYRLNHVKVKQMLLFFCSLRCSLSHSLTYSNKREILRSPKGPYRWNPTAGTLPLEPYRRVPTAKCLPSIAIRSKNHLPFFRTFWAFANSLKLSPSKWSENAFNGLFNSLATAWISSLEMLPFKSLNSNVTIQMQCFKCYTIRCSNVMIQMFQKLPFNFAFQKF